MFTGIIEDTGRITDILKKERFITVTIGDTGIITGLKKGDSIAVDGVCLTVSGFTNSSFFADISPETIKKTTFGKLHTGDTVNLEPAVTPAGRLGGHMVSGHVDGVGELTKKKKEGEGHCLFIKADEHILKYIIKNGSVAVDGISLTVADIANDCFKLMLIPHTLSHTAIIFKREGALVNIECDMIGKYVERFVNLKNGFKKDNVTYGFLREHGFA